MKAQHTSNILSSLARFVNTRHILKLQLGKYGRVDINASQITERTVTYSGDKK
jgi:hypothetical protein